MTMSLVLLVIGLMVIVALMAYATKKSNGLNRDYYKSKWNRVNQTATNGDSGLRVAVIDGDKLVDQALKASRVHGETMSERMKQASYLKSIDGLWTAHKLRNKLVHEPDIKLKRTTAMAALDAYRKTLKELGAL